MLNPLSTKYCPPKVNLKPRYVLLVFLKYALQMAPYWSKKPPFPSVFFTFSLYSLSFQLFPPSTFLLVSWFSLDFVARSTFFGHSWYTCNSTTPSTKSSLNMTSTLAEDLHTLLNKWKSDKGADEYYDLPLRSPYKAQVVSAEFNRFGGGMGAYLDSCVNDVPDVPYINATPFSFPEDTHEFQYIGTMCPKSNTISHFWQMVWFKQTRVVVNLTHENDRIGSERGDKRERYWPPYSCEPSATDLSQWPLLVETVASSASDRIPGLYLYTIQLTNRTSGETRNVKLFWYALWEDFGDSSAIYDTSFRENALNVLLLANEVDIAQRSTSLDAPDTSGASSSATASTSTPSVATSPSTSTTTSTARTDDSWLIVHCSAGVGKIRLFFLGMCCVDSIVGTNFFPSGFLTLYSLHFLLLHVKVVLGRL